MVQWLGLQALLLRAQVFIPDWEAKIPQATWPNKLIN